MSKSRMAEEELFTEIWLKENQSGSTSQENAEEYFEQIYHTALFCFAYNREDGDEAVKQATEEEAPRIAKEFDMPVKTVKWNLEVQVAVLKKLIYLVEHSNLLNPLF